jgi:hypothetical protein
LICYINQLTTLPTLPDILVELDCSNNQLTTLPALPDTLVKLDCSKNQLTTLSIPYKLRDLSCFCNQLTTLPILPNTIESLTCNGNQLTTLPILPNTISSLYFHDNPYNTTFANLITYNKKNNFKKIKKIIKNIREYYRTIRIQAKNTVALQLALFKVRSCDIPDHCFSLIGSYLSGEKGSLNTQVDKLRSKLN